MTCQSKENAMDIDVSKATNGHCSVIKKNGLLLYPVAPQVGGEGLPYAPINWPDPGDTWSWRVGRRTSVSGYHVDRYLYPPSRLQKSRKGKESFKSKLSVQEYIQALCPNVDVEAFFSSFSWKIPSKQAFLLGEHHDATCMLSEERTEESLSDCQNGDPACKAGNRFCRGLTEEANIQPVNTMFCDICCIEANFCRDCSCILCCKTIDLALGGYSFIRCEAEVHDGLVCGHSAHLVCALRCYLAGTVGGTIGLDAEYYCRRCDSKTGLVEHVTKIFKTCESVESPGDVKKMLDLVVCLTRGSHKGDVKRLMNRAQRALQKFECGNVVGNILEAEEDISTVKTVEDACNVGDSRQQTPANIQKERCKLNFEIEQILEELKNSQQYERKVAQKTLLAQRDLLLQLHQQLDSDKSTPPSARLDAAQTEKKIKQETKRFREMAKVAAGFGKVPRDVLDKYFDLKTDD